MNLLIYLNTPKISENQTTPKILAMITIALFMYSLMEAKLGFSQTREFQTPKNLSHLPVTVTPEYPPHTH